jgi:hypothetical protein
MVSALLLETVLFIIRTTLPPKMHQAAARRAQEARMARQNQRQQLEATAGAGAEAAAPAGSSDIGSSGGGGQAESSKAEPVSDRKPAAEKKAD